MKLLQVAFATVHLALLTGCGGGGGGSTPTPPPSSPAPFIAYAQTQYALDTGIFASLTPTSTGGTVVTWTVSPALPAGLSLNAATGIISGTPTSATASATYVVTATNSGGNDTFDLALSVQNSLLVDLGHADELYAVHHDGNRIVSVDSGGRGVLWNAQTGAILATRDAIRMSASLPCGTSAQSTACYDLIALKNDTAALQSEGTIHLIDATSGASLATISAGTLRWWRLASDGSYVATATDTEVKVWSRTGALTFTKAANYGAAKAFAAAGELRIGGGPAGVNVVEKISVPAGASTVTTSHQGTFHSWFDDGEKFISNVGTTVWIYSHAAASLDVTALDTIEQLTGQGDWFWTHSWAPKFVKIYRVGASTAPTSSFNFTYLTQVIPGKGAIGALDYNDDWLSVIDLSGATPVRVDFRPPTQDLRVFSAASPDDWVIGTSLGVMMGEASASPPQIYAQGQAQSIVADNDTVVVATAAGKILQYDADNRALVRTIDYPASRLEMSPDGTRVAAAPTRMSLLYAPNRNLRMYSLTDGSLLHEWTYPPNLPNSDHYSVSHFDIASNTDLMVRTQYNYNPPVLSSEVTRIVTTLDDVPTGLGTSLSPGLTESYLSPDGSLLATPTQGGGHSGIIRLYANGNLLGAVPGNMAGWLDNSHMVSTVFVDSPTSPADVYDHTEIISTTGVVLATLNIPQPSEIQVISPNVFYAPNLNSIFDATTGAIVWSSSLSARGIGAVAGDNVAFATGAKVNLVAR